MCGHVCGVCSVGMWQKKEGGEGGIAVGFVVVRVLVCGRLVIE